MTDLPPPYLTHLVEQRWALISKDTDELVVALLDDAGRVAKRLGNSDDSALFDYVLWVAKRHSRESLEVLAAAALVKLARAPKTENALNDLDFEPDS